MTNQKNISAIYHLSPMQQGILFQSLYAPESEVYFEQISMDLIGEIDIFAFENAWQKVVDRYSIFRTIFIWKNRQEPLQIVLKEVLIPWQNLDWRKLDFQEQQRQLKQLMLSQRKQGFNFRQAPLMNFTLVRLADDNYKFIWNHHHILMDGWCLSIIFKEVLSFYEAQRQGVSCQLSKPTPYSDYIAWLNSQDKDAAVEFWQQNLQGFTAPTPLIVEKTISQSQQYSKNYDEIACFLSADCTQDLGTIAQKNRCTISTIVQAAWALLLSHYSSESDIVFGVTVSGRPPDLPGIENMVGLFINTLPLRVKVSREEKLISWLQQVQHSMVELQQYSYTSLVEIQAKSDVSAGTPLFDSIVLFENYPFDSSLLNQQYSLQLTNIDAFEKTNDPLTIVAFPGEKLSVKISYDTARFDEDTIERMLEHLQNILEGIAENPYRKVGDLPLISQSERQKLLVEWNNTTTEYPKNNCIHQLFEQQVEKTPNAVAVVFKDEQLTYEELNARANQLANYLQSVGVVPEVLVGICVERSIEMLVGILGILKAGGAYLPLDPAYPSKRLTDIFNDSQVSVLLTQNKLLESLPKHQAKVICLDTDLQTIVTTDKENLVTQLQPKNLAYIVYTSGSTGKPKGVAIEHRNLVNAYFAWEEAYQLGKRVRSHLQMASFSFDVFSGDMVRALCSGGKLVICPREWLLQPEQLYQLMIEQEIDCAEFVPAVVNNLMEYLHETKKNLNFMRLLVVGSDSWYWEEYKKLQDLCGSHTRLINSYGVTEATIDSCYFENTGLDLPTPKLVPIGRSFNNTQVYILNEYLQPVPIGVPGELHIGGAGIARGYLNLSQLSAQKFITNPFENSSNNSKLY